MTLTSNIDPAIYGDSPQQWLDSIPWPAAGEVKIRFEGVKTEDFFFRRGYVKVRPEGATDIAALARARGVEGEDIVGPKTEKWLGDWLAAFGPHVSLL
jgi:2',3'-cyclic-nucleotide 3'-phosphodiesterase